jgi:hypothetical protein
MVMLLIPPTRAVGGPRETPFKKNSTVPVAAPGVTVAVKVIFELSQEGLLFDVTVVVVVVCAPTHKGEKDSNRMVIKETNLRGMKVLKASVSFI